MPLTIPLTDSEIHAVSDAMRDVAARIVLPMFDSPAPIQSADKSGHGDWVTEGDIQAERALTDFIMKLRPESVIIGEEVVGTDVALYHKLRQSRGLVWTIDPIDGTANFRKKDPGFGLMIACIYNNIIQHAWIYCPRMAGGILLTASRGRGAFAHYDDGKPSMRLQTPPETQNITVGGYHLRHDQRPNAHGFAIVKEIAQQAGLALFTHSSMAADAVDMVLSHQKALIYSLPKLWDSAPPALILNESGGIGGPINHFAQDIYAHNGEGFYVFAPNQAAALRLRAVFGQKQAA